MLREDVITSLITAGRFSQAAKLLERTGEMLCRSGNDEEAMTAYSEAADHFVNDNANSSANRCLKVAAELQVKVVLADPDADDATKMDVLTSAQDKFASIGNSSLDNQLTKFSARNYFLQAVLCALARDDSVAAERALEEYKSRDYSFEASNEGKLASALVDAVSRQDATAYTDAVYQFDSIKKLDPWHTNLLLAIKRLLGGGAQAAVGADAVEASEGGASATATGVNNEDELDLT